MTGVFLSVIMGCIAREGMEDLHFLKLWDIYHPLLTQTQQEITNLYFNCDLSLAEIAEEKGCSRQSVSDCLATCRKQLEEYEEKLHFSRTLTEISLMQSFFATDIAKAANAFPVQYREKIEGILERDYTQEAARAIEENGEKLL